MPIVSTDSRKAFVDTNVFIYAHDHRDPRKQKIAQNLVDRLIEVGAMIFCTQVLNEVCAVLLRKNIVTSLSAQDVAEIIADLSATSTIEVVSPETTLTALSVVDREGLSWYDALIWAAAKQSGATVLYSEDFQDGRTIQGVTFINPFAG